MVRKRRKTKGKRVKDCGYRTGLRKHSSKRKCKSVWDFGRGTGLRKNKKRRKR